MDIVILAAIASASRINAAMPVRRKDTDQHRRADDNLLRDLAADVMVRLSSPFNLVFLLALLPQLVSPHNLDLPGIVLIVTAVVVGAAMSQVGASLAGAASRGVVGTAARRIQYAGSLSLIGLRASPWRRRSHDDPGQARSSIRRRRPA